MAFCTEVSVEHGADFEIDSITLSCTSSAGGASRGTVQITDGTNDIIASDVTLVSGGGVVIDRDTTPALVAAQRARTKSDRLQVDVTTVASEVVTDLVVVISGHHTGHFDTAAQDEPF